MKESTIEAYLRDRVKVLGGKAYKFVSPGNDGVPDRLVCLPGGLAIFVELKAPGKNPTALQLVKQKELFDLGFMVYILDSKDSVNRFIAEYCEREAIPNETKKQQLGSKG